MTQRDSTEERIQALFSGANVGRAILNRALASMKQDFVTGQGDVVKKYMAFACQLEALSYLLEQERPDLKDIIQRLRTKSHMDFIDMFGDLNALNEYGYNQN